MQRKNPTYAVFSALALAAWMVCGGLVYKNKCCNLTINKEIYTGQLLIQDGNEFKVQHNEVIAFAKNSEELILSKQVSEAVFKLVRYIKSKPIKRLTIIGLSLEGETGGIELARARAAGMKKIFIDAGTPAYQIRTAAEYRNDLPLNASKDILLGGIDFSFDCLAPFVMSDSIHDFYTKALDNFVFDYNSAQFLMPLSTLMQEQVQLMADYLKAHKNRQLRITGYNHPAETHYGALPNLGLARANTIRSLLVQAGTPANQVFIDGIAEERLAVLPSELYGKFLPNALGFKFEAFSTAQKKAAQKRLRKTEVALKKQQVFRLKDFEEDKEKIIVDDQLKKYLSKLILYLANKPQAAVYALGHSNTLKTKEESALKAKKRADYVRDFLVEQGISPTQIHALTAGDTHPLGKPTTKYGRQINSRVDLFISYDGKEPKLYISPVQPIETIKTGKNQQQTSKEDTTTVQLKERTEQ